MSLRARVLIGTALVAVVLAVAATVITRSTHSHLLDQVDAQLASASSPGRALGFGGPGGPRHPPPGAPQRLSTLYAGVVTGAGEIETVFEPNLYEDRAPLPSIDVERARRAARTGDPFTVGSDQDGLRYRVRAGIEPRSRQLYVLALPLDDVDNAIDRLVTVEVAATALILAVLALVAWWVVHLGVRPIKQMTHTASAIAAGELSHRVPEVAPSTEAGQLGIALNRMLGRIEDAFDERARSQERLRQFVADASHELRTPVTTIRGYAELYRAGGLVGDGDLDEAMRRTEQEAVRMGNLVDDMLQLARLDQGRPLVREPVDIAALARDATRDASAVDPDRAVTSYANGPLVVVGDSDRLRQVVANLVANALVHTDAGTPIEVRATRAGDSAVLEVVDHGAGMPPEVAARAFERFYRADPARTRHRGGSGLGLAIVRATVDAHGGDVTLESQPGLGTTVRVSLPLDARPEGNA
jgi:two-component system, OmpR family, sensor kinase